MTAPSKKFVSQLKRVTDALCSEGKYYIPYQLSDLLSLFYTCIYSAVQCVQSQQGRA